MSYVSNREIAAMSVEARGARLLELQGDHKKKAAEVLKNNGFNVEVR